MKKTILILLLSAIAASSASAQGQATVVNEQATKNVNYWTASGPVNRGSSGFYSGDTTGGPQWDRPFADGSCCSGAGPVTYETELMFVDTTAAYDINSTQDGWDGYLFIYEGSFDPGNQTANFVAGDDDGNGGIGTSDIEGLTLETGVTYIVVTTGFSAGEEGTYTNTVSGPGNISFGAPVAGPVVPIPTVGIWGTLLLILLTAGMAFLVLQRRFGI